MLIMLKTLNLGSTVQHDRRFIRDYSKVAEPLTKLTSTPRPFTWTKDTEAAFARLKGLFTTAPVLCHPDPAQQFVVEMDALNIGLGAFLSQSRFTSVLGCPGPSGAKPILPPACVVKALTWQVEEWVWKALRSSVKPSGAPPNTLFVPGPSPAPRHHPG